VHASTCFCPEANERYHGVVTEPQGMRQAKTARQWELVNGGTIVDWMRTSGVAQRMLADICFAVEATVSWTVHNEAEMARRVIAEFPSVLSKCDSLDFDTMEQALAYLILHLPDRYTRAFQVLEQLLVNGVLPLGKRHNLPQSISARDPDRPSSRLEISTPRSATTSVITIPHGRLRLSVIHTSWRKVGRCRGSCTTSPMQGGRYGH
jgi:hypothetical protein